MFKRVKRHGMRHKKVQLWIRNKLFRVFFFILRISFVRVTFLGVIVRITAVRAAVYLQLQKHVHCLKTENGPAPRV